MAAQTVAVQGFGNVGSYYALFMQQEGAKVVALSDSTSAVYNPKGIDIPSAIAHKQERGTLEGLAGVERITNEELIELDCDDPRSVRARAGDHRGERRQGEGEARSARARTARPRRPPTRSSRTRASSSCPDVLANAGGVVVSYFEWVQGLQEYFWKEEEVNAKLKEIADKAFEETWHIHKSRDLSLRLSAYGLAVQRVAEATTTRGLYP